MADDVIYVRGVRTANHNDVAIDYNYLANRPQFDTGLTEEGKIADAKAVGDKINVVEKTIQTLEENKADIKYVDDNTSALKATAEDDGKILRVVKVVHEDESESWEASWQSASSALDATQEDEGKILTVVKVVGDDESESWVSLWQTPTDALDTLYANADNEGKVLRVVKDDDTESLHVKWEPALNALDATKNDNGKILTVVNGEARWEDPFNAFTPSTDNSGSEGGDGEGDEGNTQNKAGQILTTVNGQTKWEDISSAIVTDEAKDGYFLRSRYVKVDEENNKMVAVWEEVPDADEMVF